MLEVANAARIGITHERVGFQSCKCMNALEPLEISAQVWWAAAL